ncbi:MAG: alanine racemase [Zetaproteobacteria bacterium]|nr:alanine racemase [Pseudobdellovibrionaceae bacterium]
MLSWIEISQKAITNNVRTFKQHLNGALPCFVLKSNAYGHGLKEVYKTLEQDNPGWISVFYLEEAMKLRTYGYQGQILLLYPVRTSAEIKEVTRLAADMIISNTDTLQKWIEAPQKPRAHIKIDTGLSRLGFKPEEFHAVLDQILPFSDKLVGILTHFANIEDVSKQDYGMKQIREFNQCLHIAKKKKLNLLQHASASAAAMLLNDLAHYDMCRIGISLYGLWPSDLTRLSFLANNKKSFTISPVLSWKTRIVEIQNIQKDTYVGYGCSFKSTKNMKIAILPVGYHDGYPRNLSNGGHAYVLCRERICKILGRICMNMMIIDISDNPNIKQDDIVTLIGVDGKEDLSADLIASWSGTINYEVLSRIHQSIERKVIV